MSHDLFNLMPPSLGEALHRNRHRHGDPRDAHRADPLSTTLRRHKEVRRKDKSGKPDVKQREYPGRKIVEQQGADDPRNQGNLAVHRLSGCPAERVLPGGQRTEKADGALDADEDDRDEVDYPESPAADPSEFQKRSGKDRSLSRYAEKEEEEMKVEDDIGCAFHDPMVGKSPSAFKRVLPLDTSGIISINTEIISFDYVTMTRGMKTGIFSVILFLFCLLPMLTAAEEDLGALASFSDPSELWGSPVEAVIEKAYRDSFRTYILGGRVMTLRMPFAQNNERAELVEDVLEIQGGGKADPVFLWEQIDLILETDEFKAYREVLEDGREKVIIFDLSNRDWNVSRDLFDIARLKAGAYRGLPHRPYVFSDGRGIREPDVYNYLYCIGRIGMDCSGFVWHILSSTARAGGVDLGRTLSRALRVPRGADPSHYVGTSFFDSRSPEVVRVRDELRNLLPGDVILFRGSDGTVVHSAVIQSVHFETGTIRYLQSTDEAPPDERGVHDSFIHFDPARPEVSLKDPSLRWSQRRFPPFPGEKYSAYSDDGERYRAYPELGGGKVVRLRVMAAPIRRINARGVR